MYFHARIFKTTKRWQLKCELVPSSVSWLKSGQVFFTAAKCVVLTTLYSCFLQQHAFAQHDLQVSRQSNLFLIPSFFLWFSYIFCCSETKHGRNVRIVQTEKHSITALHHSNSFLPLSKKLIVPCCAGYKFYFSFRNEIETSQNIPWGLIWNLKTMLNSSRKRQFYFSSHKQNSLDILKRIKPYF